MENAQKIVSPPCWICTRQIQIVLTKENLSSLLGFVDPYVIDFCQSFANIENHFSYSGCTSLALWVLHKLFAPAELFLTDSSWIDSSTFKFQLNIT